MYADVLVVGASPAGIMAATSAAQEGAEVILLDKDMDGAFDHPANTFFDGMFRRAGLPVERECVLHDLEGMQIISPSGHGIEIRAPGHTIDRARFDELYLRRAKKAGAELVRGEAMGTALLEGEREVKTDRGEIRAKVVIDAAGVESTLARKAGLAPLRHPEDVAWAAEAVVELPSLGEERFFQYWIGSMAPGWKATFSPSGGDIATLGVFVRGCGKDVRPFLDAFVERFKRYKSPSYEKADGLKVLRINRGGDPIATLPGEIVSDSLMVVGAAAGQSGMAYAMRAGSICGSVAARAVASKDVSRNVSKKALSRYVKLWNREFYWEYRLGRASLETLRRMSDPDIDSLALGLEGKDLEFKGTLLRKSISAGLALTAARPQVMPTFVKSFLEG